MASCREHTNYETSRGAKLRIENAGEVIRLICPPLICQVLLFICTFSQVHIFGIPYFEFMAVLDLQSRPPLARLQWEPR